MRMWLNVAHYALMMTSKLNTYMDTNNTLTWWKTGRSYGKRLEWKRLLYFYICFCCSQVGWLTDKYMFLRLRRKISFFRSARWPWPWPTSNESSKSKLKNSSSSSSSIKSLLLYFALHYITLHYTADMSLTTYEYWSSSGISYLDIDKKRIIKELFSC